MSKWYLVLGSLEAHRMAVLGVLLVSSLLNAAYLMPIVYRAFFWPAKEALFENKFQEAPLFCVVPLMLTAFLSILLLFYPEPFFRLASMVARGVTGG